MKNPLSPPRSRARKAPRPEAKPWTAPDALDVVAAGFVTVAIGVALAFGIGLGIVALGVGLVLVGLLMAERVG